MRYHNRIKGAEAMKIPKILSMYLPQFHRVKENDEWWGEGFTDWNTVKLGKPLYSGHEQPVEPLAYYDLLNKDVMRQQAEDMHRYGIDGMCFYHYYFENGRMILERPAENLLKWDDIDMPFCFYWANQSWIRSWSNVSGNSWTEIFESTERQEGTGVLLNQAYGARASWEAHFRYLLPFFKDSRYLKVDGRPVFVIYDPADIEHLEEMISCWNELIEKEGMPSVFFIGNGGDYNVLDKAMLHEPMNTWLDFYDRKFQNQYGFQFYLDYDEVWEKILHRSCVDNNVYLGGFVGFDDTPRRGYKGKIMYGATPEKFQRYMTRLLIKAGNMGNEFIFINAWNEWGEGMYLEPDKRWGYQYLEAVKKAKDFVENYGDIVGEACLDHSLQSGNDEEIKSLSLKSERYRGYWKTSRRWIAIHLREETICKQFLNNKYRKIAIYGLGVMGELLVQEMDKFHIEIAYGIDQDEHKGRKFDFPIYRLQDTLPEADIVVITVNYAVDKIKQQLSEKMVCSMISLNDLLEFAQQKIEDT